MESSSEHSSNETSLSENDGDIEEESENSLSNSEMDHVRKDLGDIPFEDLDKMQNKVGLKRYGELLSTMGGITHSEKEENARIKAKERVKVKTKYKDQKNVKRKKNSPLELSSKMKVPKFRKVIETKRKLTRDPRFDDLSGTYNEEMFEKSYSFITEMKQKEKTVITEQYKKERHHSKKQELGKLLQKLEQDESRQKQLKDRKDRDKKRRKEEIDMIKKGKKPYYLKNSERRKLELMEKFKTLKKSGKLEKYLSKKRRRNAAKERRKLPSSGR